jgi:subtilase family serine protease
MIAGGRLPVVAGVRKGSRGRLGTAAVGCVVLAALAAAIGTGTGAAQTTLGTSPVPPTPLASAQCFQKLGLRCYSPQQLQRAYGLTALYRKGYDGRGRAIVIVDPFGSPTIAHDLSVFDAGFGLPAPPHFRILRPVGAIPPFDPNDPRYPEMVDKAGETTLDVEWAHAIAPGASIVLVETPSVELPNGAGFPKLMAAENHVINRHIGDVISQSFSLPERNFGRAAIEKLRYAYKNAFRHHVSVLAATNDNGVAGPTATGGYYQHRVVQWPATDPLVTAVGGTALHLNAGGGRTYPDTAWNDTHNPWVTTALGNPTPWPWATSGGRSVIFRRPRYQDGVRRIVRLRRGVPDISMSAAFSGGVAIYESFVKATAGWGPAGGTSEATPEFAGIVAIADQYAHRRLGLINPFLYALAARHARGLIDVTQGNNSVAFALPNGGTFAIKGYEAKRGYDSVTGLGTLNAGLLIPELSAVAR